MEFVTVVLLGIIGLLIILILIFFFKKPVVDISAKIDASLREQFINFQSSIHKEIDTARQEIGRSKDLISDHTVKTIDTIKDMGAAMHKIVQQQEEAQQLGRSLKDLLQVPKLRGNYGEAILEEMLERVLPKGIWERQYLIEGREQVDAVVKIKDVIIPIDAKFPRDDYQKYLEAPSLEEKNKYWKSYENALKIQIKSINNKYVKPEKGTADFALMFIPSEAIYYETIAEKNYLNQPSRIYEYAQNNKVIPVSPNTFYAFLQIIIISVRNLEVVKNAKKFQSGLLSLEKSFDFFYRKHEEAGKLIEKAAEAYRLSGGHVARYKRQLERTLEIDGFQGTTANHLESEMTENNGS